jgi:A/G-specific adenine glycosylase
MTFQSSQLFQRDLLRWYADQARDLPWRERDDQVVDPYRVWLSEIMLQQTMVATVKRYYEVFTEKWPTVFDLASAKEDDVLAAWSGLGYYSRARNLYRCARYVVEHYNGVFPDDESSLKKLPGIGDYTAAAIRAIAFNQPAVVVDGNIERITSRVLKFNGVLPKAKKELKKQASFLFEGLSDSHGDFPQALMDLGATICSSTSPRCLLCPVQAHCAAYHTDDPELYPCKAPKKKKPVKYATAFFIQSDDGSFYMRKRGDEGMLAGLYEIPTSEWKKNILNQNDVKDNSFFNLIKKEYGKGQITHSFTHFDFVVDVLSGDVECQTILPDGEWIMYNKIKNYGVPTVMKKIIDEGRRCIKKA